MKQYRTFWIVSALLAVAVGCGPKASSDAPPANAPFSNTTASNTPSSNTTAAPTSPTPTSETSAAPAAQQETNMGITQKPFGKTPEGEAITLYTCTNANGLVVSLINYGATVVRVETPDRDGMLANINWGFDQLAGYLGEHPYFGATVGRYCNRIAQGKFTLDGQPYTLAINNAPNHLHGGEKGFNRVVWKAETVQTDDAVGVRFRYTSPDGEEGYPGELQVAAEYLLTNDNALQLTFTASTDKATVLNLTNHNYWNLGGVGSGSVLDHELRLTADQYLPVDDTLIPTGELAAVEHTPFDFTSLKKIGAEMNKVVAEPAGYDHCFVLRGQSGELSLAAEVKNTATGRVMQVFTTQPGIQLYTGNFLDGSQAGAGAKQHAALCLETQHYPDSPNQKNFPSTVLRPGETFQQTTVYQFSVE